MELSLNELFLEWNEHTWHVHIYIEKYSACACARVMIFFSIPKENGNERIIKTNRDKTNK